MRCLITKDLLIKKIKFKTEQERFEIDFLFKDYHDLLADNGLFVPSGDV